MERALTPRRFLAGASLAGGAAVKIIKRGLAISQTQTRRRFVTTMALAGAASVIHVHPALAAERGLETTAVRLAKTPDICGAPQYVAEQLLGAEGFSDIRYVAACWQTGMPMARAAGSAAAIRDALKMGVYTISIPAG